jgi:phospholipase C
MCDAAATTSPGDGTIGDVGFDFSRFGVRVPAILVPPLIASGTVFRSATGRIDHASMLKTIQERWGVESLTRRDRTAASLAGVLTLDATRSDDPLDRVATPVLAGRHPNASKPSKLEKIHVTPVLALQIRNEKGHHEEAALLPTSSARLATSSVTTLPHRATYLQRQHLRRMLSR